MTLLIKSQQSIRPRSQVSKRGTVASRPGPLTAQQVQQLQQQAQQPPADVEDVTSASWKDPSIGEQQQIREVTLPSPIP